VVRRKDGGVFGVTKSKCMWGNKRGGGRCTQEAHCGRVGCLLVLNSLEFRLSVMHMPRSALSYLS